MNTYEKIYKELERLTVNFSEYSRWEAPGFMALFVEKIGPDCYSLAHYYEQNGDLCPDPDMTFRVYPDRQMAEPLTMQTVYGYHKVYPEPGKVNPRVKKELRDFALMWFRNLKAQGHVLKGGAE